MPIRPIGRLTRKMLRHPMKPTSKPPKTGPAVVATAPAAVQIPIARAAAGALLPHALLRSASEHGTSRAAPPPCSTRAPISPAGLRAHLAGGLHWRSPALFWRSWRGSASSSSKQRPGHRQFRSTYSTIRDSVQPQSLDLRSISRFTAQRLPSPSISNEYCFSRQSKRGSPFCHSRSR